MNHFIIPDVQAKPGNSFKFLEAIGNYIVDKKPDTIVNIGDFADMPSLSSYDIGKKSFEGRRYTNDIEAAREAMQALVGPIEAYNRRARRNKEKLYRPKMVLTLGNHCERINRAVENDAKLEGLLSIKDLMYDEAGWEVHPFLDVAVLDGVAYSHYFTTGVAGRPASSAAAQLRRTNMSAIAGHQQGLQIATGHRADGKRITNVIAGSCYEHDEAFMGAQGNKHWRGALMLYDVQDGEFNMVPVPVSYFTKNYL